MESTFCKITDISYSNNQNLSNRFNNTDKSKKKFKTNIKDAIKFISKKKNEFTVKNKLNKINNHYNLIKK